jgi:hypothetical protein
VNENIIDINVPNAISIVIMAALGAVIYGAIKKMLGGRQAAPTTQQQGANTTLYGMI